jgi:hypothetical protein
VGAQGVLEHVAQRAWRRRPGRALKATTNVAPERRGAIALPAIFASPCLLLICAAVWGYKLCG